MCCVCQLRVDQKELEGAHWAAVCLNMFNTQFIYRAEFIGGVLARLRPGMRGHE